MSEFFNRLKDYGANAWTFVPGIDFLWPTFLWLLLIVPLLVGAYVWLLKQRNPRAWLELIDKKRKSSKELRATMNAMRAAK